MSVSGHVETWHFFEAPTPSWAYPARVEQLDHHSPKVVLINTITNTIVHKVQQRTAAM